MAHGTGSGSAYVPCGRPEYVITQAVDPPTGDPHGWQHDSSPQLWCVLASVGDKPSDVVIGKGNGKEAWFGWRGQEYHRLDWFRYVGPLTQMREPNCPAVCHQEGYGDLYFALAKVIHGHIPAKATFQKSTDQYSTCWYTYNGVEYTAEQFEYLC